MKAVEPAHHEFAANYLFAEDGLTPYFAADSQVKAGGGSQRGQFALDGERWTVRLYYQSSGIVHPGRQLPDGTEFRLDEIREFRFAITRHSDEDSVGEQSLNAHLSPRWQGMEAEKSDGTRIELSIPDDIQQAVNVRITGSNIAFDRYQRLLQKAASAVGIRWDYFETPHEYSNVQDAGKYVRVHHEASGPIHGRSGPIASMGHLLEHDREGYRKVVQNDTDEHGRNLPGYYHTVTLGQKRVQEAFPSHDLPVEVKHYYAREALSMPDDHPLRHPKVEAAYQVSRWDETLGVDPDSLAKLERELDRILHSVLAEAGLDLAPGHGDGPFVEDAYFEAAVTDEHEEPVSLELTHIRHQQESVVVRYLSDGLSDVQQEALGTLVADGGEVSPLDIAEENGRHVGSVRRALRKMEELVEREYGKVALRSSYVAGLVHDAVSEAQESISRAVKAGTKAVEAAERGIDSRTSAWLAWASRYGVDYQEERDARMTLRFGEVERSPLEEVKRGYKLWKEMGRDPAIYRQARVLFEKARSTREGVDRFEVDAWRFLQQNAAVG